MHYKRLEIENRDEFEIAWKIYEENFPQYEKRRLDTQLKVSENRLYSPMAIYGQEGILGILFYWTFEDFTFLEHFAIDKMHRGSGLGTSILKEFCEKHEKVILEIDPLESEIAVRRKFFYERLGFCLNDYSYSHPGYEVDYPEHELRIMSLGEKLDKESFQRFLDLRDKYTLV